MNTLHKIALTTLTTLFLAFGTPQAGIYKCEMPGGEIAYQAKPCPDTGGEVSINYRKPANPAPASAKPKTKTYTGKPLTLNFRNSDLGYVLRILADFSGHRLDFPAELNRPIRFTRVNEPWDKMLDDLMAETGLQANVEGGAIRVTNPTGKGARK